MKRFFSPALPLSFLLLGFAVPPAPPSLPAQPASAAPSNARIETSSLAVEFDLAAGQFSAWRIPDQPLLERAVVLADTSLGTRRSSDAAYSRTFAITRIVDKLGPGQQLALTCRDGNRQLDLEIRLTLYDNRNALAIETLAKNASNSDLFLPKLEPVRARLDDGAACRWPGVRKLLTNGKMYYDPGRVLDFTPGTEHRGFWDTAFYSGDGQPGLVVGYLGNSTAIGEITSTADSDTAASGRFTLTAISTYQKEFTLRPGVAITSDRVLFQIAPDPFIALESYGGALAATFPPRHSKVVNGWCSWFSTYGSITEIEVLRNAEFAAKYLKPYGFECIQVDDGFYRTFSDWEGNDRFPHGMKWLADRIRQLGLTPGIWLAPYIVTSGTPIYNDHPDWLIHNPDGEFKQVGPNLVEGSEEARKANPKLHALDITQPDAARWFQNLFHTAAQEWGYDFIKIDFVDWSILAADRFHDPTVPKAAVYRKGAELMRLGMGPNKHLLDCGPGNVSLGLLDSMRIELDQPPVTWNQYFLQSASSAPAAAKRYFLHKRAWINDADHLVMMYLTVPQAQAAASVIALSGGTTMSGDRLTDLDPVRLEIFRKILPAYGQAARPVDLFERDRPEVFALPIKKPFGEWLVLGLFNADEKADAAKSIPLDRLGLDPTKTYLAFDFWSERFFGEVSGTLNVQLQPASCKLLALHEKRDTPQVLSTSRHVTQGAVELESVAYDPAADTLNGVSLGPVGSSHYVYVYLPDERPWSQVERYYFHDFPGYTAKVNEPHILRIQVRFEKDDRVEWQVRSKEF